jgi:hypothetical protein
MNFYIILPDPKTGEKWLIVRHVYRKVHAWSDTEKLSACVFKTTSYSYNLGPRLKKGKRRPTDRPRNYA